MNVYGIGVYCLIMGVELQLEMNGHGIVLNRFLYYSTRILVDFVLIMF